MVRFHLSCFQHLCPEECEQVRAIRESSQAHLDRGLGSGSRFHVDVPGRPVVIVTAFPTMKSTHFAFAAQLAAFVVSFFAMVTTLKLKPYVDPELVRSRPHKPASAGALRYATYQPISGSAPRAEPDGHLPHAGVWHGEPLEGL